MSAKTANPPAIAPPAPPLTIDEIFSEISVFASSISSRTSSDAFVETSVTTSPSDFSAGPLSHVAGPEGVDGLRENDPAGKRGQLRHLRAAYVLGGVVGLPGGL